MTEQTDRCVGDNDNRIELISLNEFIKAADANNKKFKKGRMK